MMFPQYYAQQPAWYSPAQDQLGQFKAPYQQPPVQTQPQAQNNGLNWVQGEAGAKSFLIAPGQSALLMDSEALRFYIKSADPSGIPMPLRVFEYSEITGQISAKPENEQRSLTNYVTREELEERLAQLMKKEEEVNE